MEKIPDNFLECETALQKGQFDELKELNEKYLEIDRQPRRSFYASFYKEGDAAIDMLFDALVMDPKFIRAARRLQDLIDIPDCMSNLLSDGKIPEDILPERLRRDFGHPIEWKSLPAESSYHLPAPIGVCQTSCPPISCRVSDFRGADFGFGVEPDGSGGFPVTGVA